MPPKNQKKQCSKPNCTGIDCPFPHPPPPKFHDAPLAPKTRNHGADTFKKKQKEMLNEFFALEEHKEAPIVQPSPSAHREPVAAKKKEMRGMSERV